LRCIEGDRVDHDRPSVAAFGEELLVARRFISFTQARPMWSWPVPCLSAYRRVGVADLKGSEDPTVAAVTAAPERERNPRRECEGVLDTLNLRRCSTLMG
jgi:hypothetical protein